MLFPLDLRQLNVRMRHLPTIIVITFIIILIIITIPFASIKPNSTFFECNRSKEFLETNVTSSQYTPSIIVAYTTAMSVVSKVDRKIRIRK